MCRLQSQLFIFGKNTDKKTSCNAFIKILVRKIRDYFSWKTGLSWIFWHILTLPHIFPTRACRWHKVCEPWGAPWYTPWTEDGQQHLCSNIWGEVVPLPLNKGGVHFIQYLENKFLKFCFREQGFFWGEKRQKGCVLVLSNSKTETPTEMGSR